MNFDNFVDNRYQELVMQTEGKEFQPLIDHETKALHGLLGYYRSAMRALMMPKCLYDYAMVSLGKRPEPKPVMVERALKQRQEQQEKASALKIVSETNPDIS